MIHLNERHNKIIFPMISQVKSVVRKKSETWHLCCWHLHQHLSFACPFTALPTRGDDSLFSTTCTVTLLNWHLKSISDLQLGGKNVTPCLYYCLSRHVPCGELVENWYLCRGSESVTRVWLGRNFRNRGHMYPDRNNKGEGVISQNFIFQAFQFLMIPAIWNKWEDVLEVPKNSLNS